jgi:formate dehydrogenase subunit gamma
METVMTPTPANVTEAVLARHADEPGALLPILHELQDALGHIPRDSVPQIAAALNLSRAEVHGVVTYYHHFRAEAPGRHVIQVCRAEACQAMGSDALMAHAEHALGCHAHGGHGSTSADGTYTLNPVYCLGLCASSPAIVVDDKLHARVTPGRFDALIATLGVPA